MPRATGLGSLSRATGEFLLPMMSSLYKNPENGVKFTDTCCWENDENGLQTQQLQRPRYLGNRLPVGKVLLEVTLCGQVRV